MNAAPTGPCGDCRERLIAFLDGELPADVADRVQQHLLACDACFRRSQWEEALQRAIRERSRPEPVPVAFKRRLLAALDEIDAGRGAGHEGAARPAWRSGRAFWPAVRRRPALAGLAAVLGLAALIATAMVAGVLPVGGGHAAAAVANPVQLHGHLACLGCVLADREPARPFPAAATVAGLSPIRLRCREVATTLRLRTNDGRLWELVPETEAVGEPLRRLHENEGCEATVLGTAHADLAVIQVARIQLHR